MKTRSRLARKLNCENERETHLDVSLGNRWKCTSDKEHFCALQDFTQHWILLYDLLVDAIRLKTDAMPFNKVKNTRKTKDVYNTNTNKQTQ